VYFWIIHLVVNILIFKIPFSGLSLHEVSKQNLDVLDQGKVESSWIR
jgi:hypothetical protein